MDADTHATTDGQSQDITETQKSRLRELFPEVFNEGKVDWGRLKSTLGEEVDLGERYGLSWKGKSEVFAKIQEKTTTTLHPQPEESVDWDTTQNMFIEGDNLEALKVLHKAYYGKVKIIYIDPPYNTGNDFVYNDDFKQARREHDLEAGIVDEEGNIARHDGLQINNGGYKHSNWLNMMYPRLFLARNLLSQDGIIFVSIDDNEVHNLRLIMNEIFGEENFRGEIAIKRGAKSVQMQFDTVSELTVAYEKVLMYTRSGGHRFKRPEKDLDNARTGSWNNHWRGTDRPTMRYELFGITPDNGQWRWSRERSLRAAANYKRMLNDLHISPGESLQQEYIDEWWSNQADRPDLLRISRSGKPEHYNPPTSTSLLTNLWTDIRVSKSQEVDALFDGQRFFDNPKSVEFMKRILGFSESNDVVMDFFSGSGTFAHAVAELNVEDDGNRKWICVQLPELTDEKFEAYKAGYKTIAQIARERIRRAGKKMSEDHKATIAQRETPLDLGFRAYSLGDSNFKKWNESITKPEEIRQQAQLHIDPLVPGAKDKDLLTEILLKRGIAPLAKIEEHDSFIFAPSDSLVISLSRQMTQELFASILTIKPDQIILLDIAFKNDLNLKTNLVLQAEKQNIIVEVL